MTSDGGRAGEGRGGPDGGKAAPRPLPDATGFGRGAPPSPGLAMLADLMNNHLDPGYAAAAARRRAGGPPSVARRFEAALTLVCVAAVGVILSVGYRQTVAAAPETARARQALQEDLARRQADTDRLQREADVLRARVASAQDAALADDSTGQQEARRLRDAEAVTGLASVRGPGVVVEVADGPPPTDPVTGRPTGGENLARVQDRDLQDVVNALWHAGAEAISVDGQRLTATSAIRSAGEAILVDFRPVDSPYRVVAAGDADHVYRAFLDSATARRFRGFVAQYEMRFSVDRAGTVTLPAGQPPNLEYARGPSPSPAASRGLSTRRGTPNPTETTGARPTDATPTAPGDRLPSTDGGDR